MSILHNSIKRSVVHVNVKEYHEHEEDTDLLGNICTNRTSLDCDTGGEVIAGANMEAEKRIRREIANSNERRRMQSINAGFQSLRTLLPHHEGEKLSKAAILQQTAEYIYNLEQEKTRLLSQNCQLMRQVQQHEGDVPPKKRIKHEQLLLAATTTTNISPESSDEGLGSMSPEPTITTTTTTATATAATTATTKLLNEMAELRLQLERERTLRIHLEEQIRTIPTMSIPIAMPISMEYHPHGHGHGHGHHHHGHQQTETIITKSEIDEDIEMQLIQAENIPLVAQTETVVCSPIMSRSSSPSSRATTPELIVPTQRLPSALEAAIKAEPKVEVEHLPHSSSSSPPLAPASSSSSSSPSSSTDTDTDNNTTTYRLYVANNTSRQNLETIVEAIRHLEGDHLFSDEPVTVTVAPKQQDAPLALTKSIKVIIPTTEKTKTATVAPTTICTTDRTAIKVEMNHYLQFHTNNHHQQQQQHNIQHQQQSRPGVIVVKQHS